MRGNRATEQARKPRDAAAFRVGHMRVLVEDGFTAAARMNERREDIAHRAAAYEERGLFTQQHRGFLFQRLDGCVALQRVVAERRIAHCVPHGVSGARHGIAAQIYHAGHASPLGAPVACCDEVGSGSVSLAGCSYATCASFITSLTATVLL